jgi:hypothetical protein
MMQPPGSPAAAFENYFSSSCGAFGGAFDQLGADQFDHRLFGAVAFAEGEAHDAGVAAGARSPRFEGAPFRQKHKLRSELFPRASTMLWRLRWQT